MSAPEFRVVESGDDGFTVSVVGGRGDDDDFTTVTITTTDDNGRIVKVRNGRRMIVWPCK